MLFTSITLKFCYTASCKIETTIVLLIPDIVFNDQYLFYKSTPHSIRK